MFPQTSSIVFSRDSALDQVQIGRDVKQPRGLLEHLRARLEIEVEQTSPVLRKAVRHLAFLRFPAPTTSHLRYGG